MLVLIVVCGLKNKVNYVLSVVSKRGKVRERKSEKYNLV